MKKLTASVAFQHIRRASPAAEGYDSFEALVAAMEDDEDLLGEVLTALSNAEGVQYHEGAFYYGGKLSRRTMFADAKHNESIALMKFLSVLSRKLGVGKHVYVVGGAVRNFVIDRPIKDIDVVIDSVALKGKDSEWFAKQLDRAIPAQTSLQTNQYGVAILTVNGPWMLDGADLQGEVIEIANARKESYGGAAGKGYKPHAVDPATIKEDITRREFTFNTLLWRMHDLANGPDKAEILDLTGCGLRDLQEGTMKCPSTPDKTFSDDPTRMLRAVKFLVKYGFKIDPEVAASIRRNAPKLKQAPQNAISGILVNDILQMSQSKVTLKVLKNLGLLDVIAEMVKKDKAFRTTLSNWARRDAKILFLFDLMDIGLPLNAKFNFLDQKQTQRLREVALEMDNRDADQFVAVLKQPGKVMNSEALMAEFNIKGPAMRQLMQVARDLLLARPDLRKDPRAMTEAVRAQYR